MSEREDEELELQALARRLDDAFQTTRPRAGFEDELWSRVQTRRPLGARLADALSGLVQGLREVPAVPLAGVAALLVVVLGIGIVSYAGLGRHSGGAAMSAANGAAGAAGGRLYGPFGKLPAPMAAPLAPNGTQAPGFSGKAASDYAGPVQLQWTGQLALGITTVPVFRYREPTTTDADQFASSLGAVLHSRPGGLLGSYDATDYTLEVRGTVQSPAKSPSYLIYPAADMPAVDAAGAGPADVASLFLAAHSLTPEWTFTAVVDASGKPTHVLFARQLSVPGYGDAPLVGPQGDPRGMDVYVEGNRIEHVEGMLPVSLDTGTYPVISSDAAVRAALGTGTPVPVTGAAAPVVKLTQAALAYVLVPAGDHSFYEPVFVFSGSFQAGGTSYTKHVVVPAIDPAQLSL